MRDAHLDAAQRQSFDQVAAIYAAARQGYPAALYDDLEAFGALTASTRVLEVGCGSGQATCDLVPRAAAVLALDPGAALIGEARRRPDNASAAFVVSDFESFTADAGSFDLVASAQAWHWIPPQIAFEKAAELLSAEGWLAVFGHVPMGVPSRLEPAFKAAFDHFAPGVWGLPSPQAGYLPTGPLPGMFAASALFGPVIHRGYAWTWDLDAEMFGQYLRTDSSYHFLPEPTRFALFDALVAAVSQDGGRLAAPWETHLYLAGRL